MFEKLFRELEEAAKLSDSTSEISIDVPRKKTYSVTPTENYIDCFEESILFVPPRTRAEEISTRERLRELREEKRWLKSKRDAFIELRIGDVEDKIYVLKSWLDRKFNDTDAEIPESWKEAGLDYRVVAYLDENHEIKLAPYHEDFTTFKEAPNTFRIY